MKTLKPAVGYVRCSTEMQEDSPEQQRREIEAYADKSGYEINEWFTDFGESGTTFQRPQFQRLLKKVEAGAEFAAVIIYDESRWGRAIDAEENTYWRVHFRRYGVEVVLVKTSIDPNHEFAPMLHAIEGVQASQYSKTLSALTYRGSSQNGIYSSGGTAPYGFMRVAVNLKTGVMRHLDPGARSVRYEEKVKWELGDPNEVEVVRRIFDRRTQGIAYVLIAKELNEAGVPCPKRGRWRNHDQKWNSNTIKSILENEAYCGTRVYNRNSMSKIRAKLKGREKKPAVRYPHWVNPKTEWIRVENAHPAIVSKDVWTSANASDEKPKIFRNTHTLNSPYLLTGMIRCSSCGFAFQGQTQKVKGHVYPKYIDGGYQAKRVCSYVALSKERIEHFVYSSVVSTLADPKMLKRVESLLQQFSEKHHAYDDAAIASLEKEQANLEKKKANLMDTLSLAEGEQMRRMIMEKLSALDVEEGTLAIKHRALSAKNRETRNFRYLVDSAKDFIGTFESSFERAPVYLKKEMLRRCVRNILVDRDRKVVKLSIHAVPALPGMPSMEPFKNKSALTDELVSARSSGART
jgi:site-specific DNA recombinase